MSKTYGTSKAGWWIGGIVVVVIALLIIGGRASHKDVATITSPESLPGVQTGNAPWSAELDHLRERLTKIGLSALSQEGTVLHIHQHLDIYVDGKPVAIPAGIGINEAARFISDIHVHDTTGIIHVESPVRETFTLGQFFDIWGVEFTAQRIGGYQNQNDKTLKVFVNGVSYTGDPRQLALDAHQEIVIAYGTNQELPNPIPSSYNFPAGY